MIHKSEKRIVVCRGQYCNMDRRADKVLDDLQERVDAINGDQYPPRYAVRIANCLSMCGAGPNAIVHPGAIPFNHLDDDDELARLVEENLCQAAEVPV